MMFERARSGHESRITNHSLESLVHRSRQGDPDAYEIIVRRFQDMAVGYGYSILGNFQSAEDAAQEAFFEAYRSLDKLREPAAFPGWFRRIVYKQCDRITRKKSFSFVALDAVEDRFFQDGEQASALEQEELKDRVFTALESLPEHERAATMLYYISGYSQDEVAQFLDVPVTTVKKRLFSARKRLREMLMDLVAESLRERRPSRDEMFATRVIDLLKAARKGDASGVKNLLEQDPRLIAARDPMGNTALIIAVNSGHDEVAGLLFDAGVEPDIYEAAAIGDSVRVAARLDEHPELLDSDSPEGFTPLALAAHFGHLEAARILLERGANVNSVSTHALGITPLLTAMFGGKKQMARLLLDHGADAAAKRGGTGWPRAGWTALHYAAGFNFSDLVEPLIARGADVNALDDEQRTPLQVAEESGQHKAARLLRINGAKDEARS